MIHQAIRVRAKALDIPLGLLLVLSLILWIATQTIGTMLDGDVWTIWTGVLYGLILVLIFEGLKPTALVISFGEAQVSWLFGLVRRTYQLRGVKVLHRPLRGDQVVFFLSDRTLTLWRRQYIGLDNIADTADGSSDFPRAGGVAKH